MSACASAQNTLTVAKNTKRFQAESEDLGYTARKHFNGRTCKFESSLGAYLIL